MKNLRLFDTIGQFNINKDNVDKPYVVSCKDGKLVYSASSKEDVEEENKIVRVLYKTNLEEGYEDVDYDDWYQYIGIENIDGDDYYKWQKVESGLPLGRYILTDTLDFSDVSIDNPYEPNGYIYGDDVSIGGEYHGDVIVEEGEKLLISLEINSNLVTKGDYIDLGLTSGTKWASCNLGAITPEGYGDFYAWGETTPKEVYDWSTYKYGNDLTKYNKIDGKTILDQEDDAVYVSTNGAAHMPTKEQIDELLEETESRWGSVNGVFGRLFTGSNGNSIFIPAAGYQGGSDLNSRGDYFGVWSASLYESYAGSAWRLNSNSVYADRNNDNRYYGYSVRGCKD